MIFLDQPIRRHDLLAVELSALDLVLEPLRRKVRHSRQLIESPLAARRKDGEQIALPRYIFSGPGGGGDPIRIGIFAGIHGDEPAGAYAVLQLVELLEAAPILAEGYHLFLYPVCNPTGFVDATRLSCSRLRNWAASRSAFSRLICSRSLSSSASRASNSASNAPAGVSARRMRACHRSSTLPITSLSARLAAASSSSACLAVALAFSKASAAD